MRLLFVLILLFIASFKVDAQENDTPFIHHIFHSEAFGEDRQITVHLPSKYLDSPMDSFMVTYVLDAQGPQFFNMVTANLDYLTSRYSIIPTLIVGIHSKNRYVEFTPFAREGANKRNAAFESKLPRLQKHFEEEVFPYIEANYRTKPFRALVGHSRGGSFVVQTLFDGHQDLFNAYLAISPALQFDNYQTIDLANAALQADEEINKFLYTSSGNVTEMEKYFKDIVQKVDSVINMNSLGQLIYHRGYFEGKDHFSTVAPALTEGMVLLKNEFMPSLENIDRFSKDPSHSLSDHISNFMAERKNIYQFVHIPSNQYFVNAANEYLEAENYKAALSLYSIVENKEPLTKWWEIFNLGKCYAHLEDLLKANKYFDQSLLLLEDYRDQYGDNFENVKKDVLKQIEEFNN